IVKHFPGCAFELIRGNHDIMSERQYQRKGIRVLESERVGKYLLTHEPMPLEDIPTSIVNVAGHIHPGAHLFGRGRQSVTLPCFWFSKNQIILPAFGSFTGLAAITPAEDDHVFVVFDNKILEANKESAKTGSRIK
ncbi:MAG TPA: hypothetical protein VG737_12735, partial [Cyclobacteriaceae bacterium]|nr:hypothetical protein [Cyclobacteriaceae bacterium]